VAVARGRVHPALRAALVVPPAAVETRAARGLLPETVPHADAAADAGRAALLVHAVADDPTLLHAGTQDWLHQRYRAALMPEAYALMSRLRAGGFAAAISGAGPSVVVLGTEEDLAGLEAAEPGTRFRRAGIGGPARAL
jgi:homoserine kinase